MVQGRTKRILADGFECRINQKGEYYGYHTGTWND